MSVSAIGILLAASFQVEAAVIPPTQTNQVVGWGDNSYGQSMVSNELGNTLAITAGWGHTLALKTNGTVAGWGYNAYGEITPPADLTNAVAISAGWEQSVALKSDGTVVQWGQVFASVPANLTNVAGIAAGRSHCLARKSNETVIAWGDPSNVASQTPTNLTNVKAIAAGWNHNLVLKGDGTVVAWGVNGAALGWHLTDVPAGVTNVKAIAAGALHSLVLKSNGTVVAWGYNSQGETNVPPDLTNVIAIAAGMGYSLAIKTDGSIVGWGDNSYGVLNVPSGLSGATSLAAGARHALAIRAGPLTPIIVKQPADQQVPMGASATFSVQANSLTPPTYQWQFNGTNIAGATDSLFGIDSVHNTNVGGYGVVASNTAGAITSRVATLSILPPPMISSFGGVSNLWLLPNTNLVLSIMVSNPASLSYQWQWNGTNLAGQTRASFTNFFSEGGEGIYTVRLTNSAGTASASWNVRFLSAGHLVGWGMNGQAMTNIPFNLPTVSAMAAGLRHGVAVKDSDGVVAWGDNSRGQTNVPVMLTNVLSVAAGDFHSLALRADGKVVSWGDNSSAQTNVPANLSNVVAIAAGGNQSVALKREGIPVVWGDNSHGQTNVPVNLSNVSAIAVGSNFDVALTTDGRVTAWGDNSHGQTNVPSDLSNVVAIAAGGEHALALRSNGSVSSWGDNINGQSSVPPGLTNVLRIAAGVSHSLVLGNEGSITGWGDNSRGQLDVVPQLNNVNAIAAGGDQSLALIFSTAVMPYPLEASKDLLLIYNSNSTDSITIKNYYLQKRPGLTNVNVLGIGCTTNETITPFNFTNQICKPIATWMALHPTKRPGCVLLFPDVPVRVNDTVFTNEAAYAFDGLHPSVSSQLATAFRGWQPLTTHLNMGDTNACKAYIDKLANMADRYSPGQLVIGPAKDPNASRTFAIDDVNDGNGYGYTAADITNGLFMAEIVPPDVFYANDSLGHITNATNVAGYFSFAAHSSLSSTFPTNGVVKFYGDSGWFLMHTYESFNGQRSNPDFSNYLKWFSSNAFGGLNFSNTPAGAIGHTDEPSQGGIHDGQIFFRFWALGKPFANCAWQAKRAYHFIAVGDPFVVNTNGPALQPLPVLLATRQYPLLVLSWSGGYTLQTSTNVNGPFMDVAGASNPFTVNLQLNPNGFFRLKQ